MNPGTIRPIAICIVRNNDRILVAEGYDSVKNQTFYRPLGGTIEFGERGIDTVKREFLEEINAEVKVNQYLGAIENIFVFEGQIGHEIVLVYEGVLVDRSLYDLELIEGSELGYRFATVWKSLAELSDGGHPIYPDGLQEYL